MKNEDLPQKISAIKNGFIPTYNPKFLLDKVIKNNTKYFYPIGSLPLKNSFLCNEGYGMITYKTDRFGLRNEDEKWIDVKNQKNIFVIGDSFVNGYCVPNKYTISNQLAKKTKINTINLGSAGNGPYEYMAIMKSLISPILKASINENNLIIIFYANDNQLFDKNKENLVEKLTPIFNESFDENVIPKQKYLYNINELISKNYPQSPEEIIHSISKPQLPFKRSTLYQITTFVPVRHKLKNIFFRNFYGNKKPFIKTLSFLKEICKNPCIPSIAYMPNSSFWYPRDGDINFKKQLKIYSKKYGIKFIDLEDVIDNQELKNYGPKGGHLSISAAKKIADLIIEKSQFDRQ